MELNVADEQACAVVEELAQLIGVDAGDVVAIAVRERLKRIKSQQRNDAAERGE